jgi:predicted  nucleic acid-binding Zn-ribbon protein
MQSNNFFSKPLVLVIIGLILGASIGLGSGYALIYPQMVNEQSKTIEERFDLVALNIESVKLDLSKLNRTFLDMAGDFQTVRSLSEAINSLNSRIIAIENSVNDLNLEQAGVEDDIGAIFVSFDTFNKEWAGILDEFDDLEDEVNAFNSKVQSIENRLDSRQSVDMLKRVLANPEDSELDKITDEMYTTLNSNQDFNDWATSIGTNPAKSLLKQEIYKLTSTFIWNNLVSSKVGEKEYQVIMETFYSFSFSPASVSITKMRMQIRGNINIATNRVYNIQVEAVEIM